MAEERVDKPEAVMTPQEIEKARIELDRKQLEIDKAAAELSKGFLNRNTGVLVSAAVSFAAVVVSLAQVWVTNISRNKELELSTLQRKAEVEAQERQKDREFAANDAQRKRELDINAARFITDNRKAIFEGSSEDKELFAKVIPALFPPEVAAPLLGRLKNSTIGPERKIWQEAQEQSLSGATYSPDKHLFATSSGNEVRIWSAQDNAVVRTIQARGIVQSVAFDPKGRELSVKTLDGCIEDWDTATGRMDGMGC